MSASITPIRRLLVANRAEIARRIFRSAHAMGIDTVAVFADGDRDAPFVGEADQAIALGGRTSAESYLDQEKILAAARRTGADAIHPGYGFLAENAEFARAVAEAGLVWVGPSADAMAAMGDKIQAKKLMVEAGVPTLPSVELTEGEDVAAAASGIGYPLLVKAAAGGGGKGMRVVESEADLEEALRAARREASSAFGDDTVFLERYVPSSRHVEIQLLGDRHGNLIHCFERECSIQRRHQKILEEAPSPVVSPEMRARMGAAAIAAGEALAYHSAGTVEFLVEEPEGDGDGERPFWFLEVNTRLQVEHPVTEEITGLDLVREQLRIAQGEELAIGQEDLEIRGHAIEARLYAEDPERDFLPATGRLVGFEPSAGARFDSGVESGSEIGIDFDPMLAKVIAHAPTRAEAAGRLARALEQTRIQGLTTNRDFLVSVLRSSAFLAGDTTTDFIAKVSPAGRRALLETELGEAGLIAALYCQHRRRSEAKVLRSIPSGWRSTVMPPEIVRYATSSSTADSSSELKIEYRVRRDGPFWARASGGGVDPSEHEVEVLDCSDGGIELSIDGRRIAATVGLDGARRFVHGPLGDVELVELPRFPSSSVAEVAGGLVAPMPGKVIAIEVSVGDSVAQGQLLLVLEAMKMEHRVSAPDDGVVTDVPVRVGDQVQNGQLLVVIGESATDD